MAEYHRLNITLTFEALARVPVDADACIVLDLLRWSEVSKALANIGVATSNPVVSCVKDKIDV